MKNAADVARRIKAIDPETIASYSAYWQSIAPTSLLERWQRWVFALLAPVTGWQQNVAAYEAVMAMPWNSREELTEVLEGIAVGCHNGKAAGIWNITTLFNDPRLGPIYLGHPDEVGWQRPGWQAWRDRIVELTADDGQRKLVYAGRKTVSFAHEMCWPLTCGVVAIDTHMATWYGLPRNKLTPKTYTQIEDHWLECCQQVGYPSAMVRHILWDQGQGYDDNRYWAHVFETSSVETATPVG